MLSQPIKLSIKSKAFVVKSNIQNKISECTDSPWSNSDLKSDSCSKLQFEQIRSSSDIRITPNTYRHPTSTSDCSLKSWSTKSSDQNSHCFDSGSETNEENSSDEAQLNSALLWTAPQWTQMTLNISKYNNFEQNHLIRNAAGNEFHNENVHLPPAPAMAIPTVTKPKKQTKRRGGRRNKPKTRQINEENTKEVTKFKTEMCKNWLEKGKWSYSVRCKFAHGPHELVKQEEPKKEETEYKSKLCNAFHKNYCPYGVRCLFIHDNRTTKELQDCYYQKSILINFEARQKINWRRLPLFQNLTQD